MANKSEPLEEFSPVIRAAFDAYPTPEPGAEFDARFWRELDARKNRYRGFAGFWRRLVEVEIEGVAVWRLGFSGLGGAAFCALGFTVLSLGSSPPASPARPPRVAFAPDSALLAPRFARDLWDEDEAPLRRRPPVSPAHPKRGPSQQEEISCVSFAKEWA